MGAAMDDPHATLDKLLARNGVSRSGFTYPSRPPILSPNDPRADLAGEALAD